MVDEEARPLMEADSGKEKDKPKAPRRKIALQNEDGEYTVNLVVVIEDFRVAFYISTLSVLFLGVILTKLFTKGDYTAIIKDVFGDINICVYVDFAPSTYITPALWCFAVVFGFVYSLASIFRVRIAHLEKKLGRVSTVLLTIAYIYVVLSLFAFAVPFAVQPDREKPETMLVHTGAYVNWQIMYGVLQVAVVWFGLNVSWAGLHLPAWFRKVSVVHAIALIICKLASVIIMVNALGDMGERLEGKGLWWSVRNPVSRVIAIILVNVMGMLLGMVFPLIQALYVCKNGVNSHTLMVAVTDNRPTYANIEYTETET